ncbi:hypothetical protein G7Y31_09505 [Corynebacterium lizhenjunii]|uniref:Uncharacterized protein n=1 Tax=Corynebacterium lizhenjunii TaxID=2709394 RepID=A0A7T0PA94_9CORY|nr:hypothetical protein [Corynebacterium lizhenjunii]QPK78766.1 hypothetical protein G7Y31_09505 [Corynebacterium lizhenjunii]
MNFKNLQDNGQLVLRLAMAVERLSGVTPPVMSAGLSSIGGVSAAGAIHGRFLHGDPASAQETLRKFTSQLDWIGGQLRNQAAAVALQDSGAAWAFDMLHVGVRPEVQEVRFVEQPPADYQTLSFVPPVVVLPRLDIGLVASQINGIDLGSVVASASRWGDLQGAATDAVAQLQSVAGALAAENSGEAVDKAVATLQKVAGTGTDFSANAGLMHAQTAAMNSFGILAKIQAATAEAVIRLIPDLAAQKAAEQAAIASLERQLQLMVDVSLPKVAHLASPHMAAGGGLAEIGMNAIAGSDKRYGTDSVTIPQAMVDAAMSGQLGPGSFEVVDGMLRPVAGIGMHDAGVQQFLRGVGRDVAGMFEPSVLPAHLGESLTGPSTVSLSGSGSGVVSGGAVPGGGVAPSGQVALGTAGTTPTGVGTVGAPGAGWAGGVPGFVPGATGGRQGGGAGSARSGSLPGVGSNPIGAGVSGGAGAGGIGSGGIGSGGALGAGQGATGGTVRGVTSTSIPGANSGGGAGSGVRGGVPMMGAGAGGGSNNRGRVKAVTSRIEQDANKRALIGDLPPAIPGVIGAWVRDEP